MKNRIRECRKAAGMTQKEVGKKVGRNVTDICRYEKGLREPSLWMWKQLASVFHVTPQYLVGWTDEPN